MDDILKEVSAAVECKDCPWYRNCLTPLQLSGEDMRQLKAVMERAGFAEAESGLEKFFESMASLSENLILQCCPILSERLKRKPALAQRIKKMMQNWGEEPRESQG